MRTFDIVCYVVAVLLFVFAAWLAGKADAKWPIPLALGLAIAFLVPLVVLIRQ